MMRHKEEKEAKKEAFRKYLDSSGVLDALTKVLVSLYEQNDKPSSALEFIQQKLGGPSVSEYEMLQAELSNLQIKYDELLAEHQETCKESISQTRMSVQSVKPWRQSLSMLEELKNSHSMAMASTKETIDGEAHRDGF